MKTLKIAGLALAGAGDAPAALEAARRALRYNPDYVEALAARGASLLSLERAGDAWTTLCRAAELGGHIRPGFESNRMLPNGQVAQDNAHLLAEELGLIARSDAALRPIATAAWVREHLVRGP